MGKKIRKSPVEVGILSHYLQGFLHPGWLFGISSIKQQHQQLMKVRPKKISASCG